MTERELKVLELIVQGHNNAAIAQHYTLALALVLTHVRNSLTKLCLNDRTQAAIRALRAVLVS